MPKDRFYLDVPFTKNAQATLENDELHHLRVMRAAPGEIIELVNGKHQLANAKITRLEKREAHLTIENFETAPAPTRQITLALALLKPKNLDLVLEKGTELGATTFLLFPGEKSEKSTLSPTQLERLRHLTISALKQCGRLDLPHIELLPPLAKWNHFPQNGYFGSLNSNNYFTKPTGDLTLYIGPEGGFSPQEEKLLSQHAKGVRLHPNTLRAETAALCFLSLSS